MPTLRFVHAADLHLDSPFAGMRADAPDHVAAALREATFRAYNNIIELCLDERVDALLVAGDVYDGADRSLRAQLKFLEGLERLDRVGIRSFVCHGNHDPLNGWEARLDLPSGCVRFEDKVEAAPMFPDDPDRACVYGYSYPRRDVKRNLARLFPRQGPDSRGFRIGLLHANVGGNPNHEAYGACSLADLEEAGIDYWALGHVHTRDVPKAEGPVIAYPGNPQGRHPNEAGCRGVYLVEVDEAGSPRLEFRPVDVIRWQHMDLDITGLVTEQAVLDGIIDLAESVLHNEGRSVVSRLALTGRGAAHPWLQQADTAQEILDLLNETMADREPWLWCERIQVRTASPVDRPQVLRREDFIGDLARLADELRQDPDALADLQQELLTLYGSTGARKYLKDLIPTEEELLALLDTAEAECLAALTGDRGA
ncbi:MAG: DNA repair exonuclease [Caldilineaceae bacterium]|nr:DNA repair exonuclease [Caldilineaceae bacterium]